MASPPAWWWSATRSARARRTACRRRRDPEPRRATAEPGGAEHAGIVAEATRLQIGGLFDLTDLGVQALARFAEPQHAWRVLSESGEVSRFEALRSGKTPFVGRDEEVDLLLRRWQQAKSGEGRVVLISGEPGIGKSRLTAARLSASKASRTHAALFLLAAPSGQRALPFILS